MGNRVFLLDVLRATAILLVFVAHTVLSYGAPASIAPLQLGGTGVDLFFVLSGWLIGSQLFKELDTYGNVDIKRFWVRRWMRTLPAYYAVLTATIVQLALTKNNFEMPWGYFVFVQNYQHPLTFFSVSWSLCVEEQFYLAIAPFLVLLAKLNRNYRTSTLFLVLILPAIFRLLGWFDSAEETHVRWDCCIMGIILAHTKYSYPKIWQSLLTKASSLAIAGLAIYVYFYIARWQPEIALGEPSKLLLAFVFGAWVIWANSVNREFDFPGHQLVMYISTRSYAIYLLHPEALAVARRFFQDSHFVVYFAIAFAVSCLIAEILYRCVELPGMKLRSKFNFSKSRSAVGKSQAVVVANNQEAR